MLVSQFSCGSMLVLVLISIKASTILFLLAQIPNSVAVVDLWVGRPAPAPAELGLSDSVRSGLLVRCDSTFFRSSVSSFFP